MQLFMIIPELFIVGGEGHFCMFFFFNIKTSIVGMLIYCQNKKYVDLYLLWYFPFGHVSVKNTGYYWEV